MAVSKRSSLLQYGNNSGLKKFYSTSRRLKMLAKDKHASLL
jgi:hypothetical protein